MTHVYKIKIIDLFYNLNLFSHSDETLKSDTTDVISYTLNLQMFIVYYNINNLLARGFARKDEHRSRSGDPRVGHSYYRPREQIEIGEEQFY